MVMLSGEGREPVGRALDAALAGAIGGSGRLVLLLGDAGIGKTTTARQVAAAARERAMAVRWSACWSGGATVAHAPWLSMLSGLGAPGRRAMEALLGSDPSDSASAAAGRASTYAEVVRALEDATAAAPALLVLDDLHWADQGTLQLLDVVAAHLPGLPMLVIGTCRDTEVPVGSPLTGLGGRADRLALRGLDEAAVADVLGDHVGPPRATELAPVVSRLTGGNPFLVVQVARLMADVGALDEGLLPSGARDLLQQRLACLDDRDRDVLRAAAILGNPFDPADVATLLDLDPAAVAAALDRATFHRIVEGSSGSARAFVHDLFRQAAAEGAGAVATADLHRSTAEMLIARDAEPAVIAAHLIAAGSPEAAAWSVQAGDRALAAMAWEEAAGHHERALVALPRTGGDDVRADALAGLGQARLLAGDESGAARCFDQLAELGRTTGSPELLGRAALGFSADLSGFEVRLFDQRQIDLLEEASRALARTPDLGLLATVQARLSVALSLVAPDERRLELAESAVANARASGDQRVLARALAAHCDAISGPAHVGRREAEASEIIAIAEAEADGPLELLGRRLRFVARLEQGDVAGVEADTAAFERRAYAVGNPLYSWYVPLWRAQMDLVANRLDEASRRIEEVDAIGGAAGSMNAPMLATVIRLMLFWYSGDNTGALRALATLERDVPELAVYLSAAGSMAWAHVLAGDPAGAGTVLDRVTAAGVAGQVVDAEWLANCTNMVRASAALAHPLLDEVLPLVEPHAGLVAFEGIGAGLYGSVARFVAVGCSAVGRHDDAVRFARQALVVNRAFGGMLTADALRTLADCLDTAGVDATEAAARHAEADAAYASIGARHFVRGGAPVAAAPPTRPEVVDELRRDGDVWHVTYRGTSTILKHSKGLADLAVLLARPGQEVHVAELEGVPAAVVAGDGGEALDRRAIAAYRDRLAELAEELDDADSAHDLARSERARIEYDALVDQLSGAVGLGGRGRSAGPEPVERLRKAVSARVRDAIRRIDAIHPALGRHLTNSVHTGIYCAYRPEVPTSWRCQG